MAKTHGTALTNAQIADQLAGLAQLLSAQRENPFKVKAYRRAAETIRNLGDSVDELVRSGADLTAYAGIGKGISSALQEIVTRGSLQTLKQLRAKVPAEVAELAEHPRLDRRRVLRIYRALGISSIAELREKLEAGELAVLGTRMEQHVRQGLTETPAMLLYDADDVVASISDYLTRKCGVTRVEPTGDWRRRVEVISELSFLVAAADFGKAVEGMQRYGGRSELVAAPGQTRVQSRAVFRLPSGVLLSLENCPMEKWGVRLVIATGSEEHVRKLAAIKSARNPLAAAPNKKKAARKPTRARPEKVEGDDATEKGVYAALGLQLVPPEIREGGDEIELARAKKLPRLVELKDLRGELHAHSTSSDGAHTIEQMAAAAAKRGYEYLGITDHSQSLRIAGGVSEEKLWEQVRRIDQLNEKLGGIRVLKSAEVDILADGKLDYPDDLLAALDYTVCSIHSRFGLNKAQQTERILRAMDHPAFTILGHATGRLLLRRPGYEIDVERVIRHAKARGCFFEINSSPDRLDLSAENARRASEAGIPIAICTDAHSIREFDFIRCGIDQARRAGLGKNDVLNCLPLPQLLKRLR
jgi:DNA polymerase (family X)